MKKPVVTRKSVAEFPLWDKISKKRVPLSFELEVTARCNNNCRHCYINLPSGDHQAEKRELSIEEIEHIADEAVQMGTLWCLITGGEPLLRKDFPQIYKMLKRKGILVSVFTNACLITEEHIDLFCKYPPREMEISVYGVTEKTYEKVTRVPGSFKAFMRGFNLLLNSGIKIRLKAMALRSNLKEMDRVAEFCRKHTSDYFRFDPQLHLRLDRNEKRNQDIISERLTPEEIVKIEQRDPERSGSLKENCDNFIFETMEGQSCHHFFRCSAGMKSFTISPEGIFRLCSSLYDPEFVYDLRSGSLKEAWESFVPRVLQRDSDNPEYLKKCKICNIINLCIWCPAHAYLETGKSDQWVEYFCEIAHARQRAIEGNKS